MSSLIEKFGAGVKETILRQSVRSVDRFSGYGYASTGSPFQFFRNGSDLDEAEVVGSCYNNSIVDICLSYIARQFGLAEWKTEAMQGKEWQGMEGHSLMGLLQVPNDHYNGEALLSTTAVSLALGNSYWILCRDKSGTIREVWWAPQLWDQNAMFGCTPYAEPGYNDNLPFCYQYRANGITDYLPIEDVIHFRNPIGEHYNPFIGKNPLRSQFRHLGADNAIADYTYYIASNYGVMGALLINKSEKELDKDAALGLKEKWRERTTGKNRGLPLISPHNFDVVFPDNSPEKMAIDKLNDTPEERIPAALGLNAMAVQLGAGLSRSTFSNSDQASKAAFDGGIAPLHKIIASTITAKLIPQMKSPAKQVRFIFDYSQIPALQEDENALRASVNELWKSGAITLSQFNSMLRLPPPLPAQEELRFSDFAMPSMGGGAALPGVAPGGDAIAAVTGVAADVALNGAQITAALDVIARLNSEEIAPSVAVSLLNAVGIPRESAQEMIDAMAAIPKPKEPKPLSETAKGATPFLAHSTGLQVKRATAEERRGWLVQARALLEEAGSGADREKIVKAANARMMSAAEALRNGDSTVAKWADTMSEEIVNAHTAQAALGYRLPVNGELPEHVLEWLGEKIAFHQEKFAGFESDVKGGRYDALSDEGAPDGYTDGLTARSSQYANATRATYENAGLLRGKDDNHTTGQRIMGAVDHCSTCEAEAAKGEQPIEEVAEIGDSECKGNCACVIITKKGGE